MPSRQKGTLFSVRLFSSFILISLGRFGLANISGGTTTFLLNLALADLLYCVINLPLYATTYLSHGWPLGQPFCLISAAFRDASAYAEWMALATVAFSRYAGLVWKDWASKNLTGTRGFLLVIATWIWAFAIMSLTFIGVSTDGLYW